VRNAGRHGLAERALPAQPGAGAGDHRTGGGQPLHRPGDERFEAVQDGAVWRFRNEGNRAAFVGHPEVYGPQFGGHDPVDVARGKAVQGLPQLWTVHAQRLYLFASDTSRTAFAANPEGFAQSAQRRWPKLKLELSQ
jgi:hypothetical protein